MAEAVAKEKVCNACGADIRPDSLFCYACGGSLESELAEIEKGESGAELDDVAQKESLGEDKDKDKKKEEKVAVKAKSPEPKAKDAEKKELKTAAALRKKPKNLGVKRVEILWEEHEEAPNVWFLVGAVVFTIIGAVLFYIAMYLK